jgi:hypothetical protein
VRPVVWKGAVKQTGHEHTQHHKHTQHRTFRLV